MHQGVKHPCDVHSPKFSPVQTCSDLKSQRYLMIYQALEQVEKDLLAVVEACAEVGRVSHLT